MATRAEWKCFMEGMGRGDVGPYVEKHRVDGAHCWREYFIGGGKVVRASLCVKDAATDKDQGNGDDNRNYYVQPTDIDATKYIYIPTDQDIEDWDEADLDIAIEIAKRELVK